LKTLLRRILPRVLWRGLQRLNQWRRDAPFRVLRKQGWVAARKDDFYSPLPVKEDLVRNKARWCKPSGLPGLKIEMEPMRQLWLRLHEAFGPEYECLPPYEAAAASGFGVGFTKADARALYYMVRSVRPKRYFEIGSGLSTYYCHLARRANQKRGKETEITCVEPFPHDGLYQIDDVQVIKDEVQNLPLEAFGKLEAGDFLFIDSSHAAKIDSDVTFLMMEVVPRVAVGVYVHIHDIPFPYNFPFPPELYIFDRQWPMYWNEPVIVQAFLQFNDSFEIVLSLPYLNFHDPELIKETVPEVGRERTYANAIGSLWLRRFR
jgi:hypothetical protein